jgi:putative peptidoglycan lipid II flippase
VAVAPIAVPLALLLAVVTLVPRFGIEALAWSVVGGYVVELLVLCASMRWRSFPLLPTRQTHEALRHVLRQYGCLFLGVMLMASSTLVDQSMATWLGPGSVSVLAYGNKLVALLVGTISLGLGTAVFPHFSRLALSGDMPAIRKTLRSLAVVVLAATIPLTGLLMLLSRPVAELLFQRGAITPETISAIAQVQCCYLLQVPAYVVGILGVRMLMALGGASTISRIAAANLGVNVAGNLVLMRFFGLAGIALSTSCVYLFSTALVYYCLKRRLREPSAPAMPAHRAAEAA